jgi:hypothetical protein
MELEGSWLRRLYGPEDTTAQTAAVRSSNSTDGIVFGQAVAIPGTCFQI